MTGYYVEFANDDVGPFRTREDAEAYWRYETGGDEGQIFTSAVPCGWPWIDSLAEFCPEAVGC